MPPHRAQNKRNLDHTALGGSLFFQTPQTSCLCGAQQPLRLPAARGGERPVRLDLYHSGLLAVPLEGEAGQGWERLGISFSSPAAKRGSASAFAHGGAARLSLMGVGGWCGAFLEEAWGGFWLRSANGGVCDARSECGAWAHTQSCSLAYSNAFSRSANVMICVPSKLSISNKSLSPVTR
jgi:hypothetical protein